MACGPGIGGAALVPPAEPLRGYCCMATGTRCRLGEWVLICKVQKRTESFPSFSAFLDVTDWGRAFGWRVMSPALMAGGRLCLGYAGVVLMLFILPVVGAGYHRSEEHTSELQSLSC